MAEILMFSGITRLDLPPDRILEAAKGKLEGVLVLGYDEAGDFYAASSYAERRFQTLSLSLSCLSSQAYAIRATQFLLPVLGSDAV